MIRGHLGPLVVMLGLLARSARGRGRRPRRDRRQSLGSLWAGRSRSRPGGQSSLRGGALRGGRTRSTSRRWPRTRSRGSFLFNDGNALYQSAELERAVEGYQRAIESGDPRLQSAAWYNLGNALYRAQQLEQSLEAYKQALRLNPADQDAKHNLERVLEQMQQQQQQPQPQDGEEDDEEAEEEQDQQEQPQPQPQPQQGEDEGDEEQEDEQEQDPQPQDEEQQQGEPRPQDGEMTREEASGCSTPWRRTLKRVDRQRAPARGRRPRKPW